MLIIFAAESNRLAADARVQQAEARAADLEKFIDKERVLYTEKIRALETSILQQKSENQDAKRSHDQQVTQRLLAACICAACHVLVPVSESMFFSFSGRWIYRAAEVFDKTVAEVSRSTCALSQRKALSGSKHSQQSSCPLLTSTHLAAAINECLSVSSAFHIHFFNRTCEFKNCKWSCMQSRAPALCHRPSLQLLSQAPVPAL